MLLDDRSAARVDFIHAADSFDLSGSALKSGGAK
jgi:hypothetical protein